MAKAWMNYLLTLFLVLVFSPLTAHAAEGFYLGSSYDGVYDNLDVGVWRAGAGYTRDVGKNLSLDVHTDYGVDASGSRYLEPFEDAVTAGVEVRFYF